MLLGILEKHKRLGSNWVFHLNQHLSKRHAEVLQFGVRTTPCMGGLFAVTSKNVNVVTVAMSSSYTLSRKITVLHNGEVDGGLCVISAQQSSVRDDSTMS